jgi:hypothetical protein
MPNNTQQQIDQLRQDLQALNDEVYRNNFTSTRDENKFVRFNSNLKVPKYTALPSTCEVSQIGVFNGKLYVCSASNTWTIVGTQT